MRILLLLAVAIFTYVQMGEAAWVKGVVKDINGDTLRIERSDANLNDSSAKEIQVKVMDDAKFKNVSSISDIRRGQSVKIDAKANKDQSQWDAKYVELIGAGASQDLQADSSRSMNNIDRSSDAYGANSSLNKNSDYYKSNDRKNTINANPDSSMNQEANTMNDAGDSSNSTNTNYSSSPERTSTY